MTAFDLAHETEKAIVDLVLLLLETPTQEFPIAWTT
jgi:hypothetical protein